jgi:hypothetical protein
MIALPEGGTGAVPSTTSLQVSANPSIFGHQVTLTATVYPTIATGSITWYDGVAVLGTARLVGGQAALATSLLGSGQRSLKAFYNGDATFQQSTSMPLSQTVTVLPQRGFLPPATIPGIHGPGPVAVGDFNGDGRTDLAVILTLDNRIRILLGNGNGTFQAPTQALLHKAKSELPTPL